MTLRVGVIGLGKMGTYHSRLVSQIHNAILSIIIEPNEKLHDKKSYPETFFTTKYQEIIGLVDAVIIAAPTPYHFEIAHFCISNGIHVLIEKPITQTLEQAKTLFNLAEKKDVTLHIGHVERFNGVITEVKKHINEPFLIEAERIGTFSPRVQHDSVVLDLMIHDIDLVLSLIGKPVKSVSSVGNNIVSKQTDVASTNITFDDGTIAHIVANRATQVRDRIMRIHQKNNVIDLNFNTQEIKIHHQDNNALPIHHNNELSYRRESIIEHVSVSKSNALLKEIEFFISAIENGVNRRNPQQDLAAFELTLLIMNQCHDIHESTASHSKTQAQQSA